MPQARAPRGVRRVWSAIAIACTSLALAHSTISAQALRGRVVHADSGRGLSRFDVRLLAADGGEVARARSDSFGEFVMGAPAGLYLLGFRRIGYLGGMSDTLRLSGPDTVEIVLRTLPLTPRLAGVLITGKAEPAFDFTQGFEQRRARSAGGGFLDRAQIEKRGTAKVLDALRGMAGIEVLSGLDIAFGGNYVVSTRGARTFQGGQCPMQILLDGMETDAGEANALRSAEIEAVEVYSVAEVPVRFRRQNQICGLILLWSRSDAGRAPEP